MDKQAIVGFDQGGLPIKDVILNILSQKGYAVTIIGPEEGKSLDYPDIARESCGEYLLGGYQFGVLLCGTGIGISIAANKIRGIRCALIHDSYCAVMARKHNNANFIAFGGRVTYHENFTQLINSYLDSKFEAGRHQLRLNKITKLEEKIVHT